MRLAAILIFLAMPAFADHGATLTNPRNCAHREVIMQDLAEKFSETRQSYMEGRGMVFEMFANIEKEPRTWTFMVTSPDGVTCLIAAGEGFENVNDSLIPTGMKT